ncbi:hypothetical protein AB0N23_20840, partial [Streptomyces sp. NPDC052644]
MVTFAQAQERAEEWINGDVPPYQHREVRVREFELGFVVWAEDRPDGPSSDGGGQRLVIARDSGEATLWPALPVGEVIRRYEEEYGTAAGAQVPPPREPERIDLNQTSFLLTPPEWLQDAADRMGVPDRRGGDAEQGAGTDSGTGTGSGTGDAGDAGATAGGPAPGATPPPFAPPAQDAPGATPPPFSPPSDDAPGATPPPFAPPSDAGAHAGGPSNARTQEAGPVPRDAAPAGGDVQDAAPDAAPEHEPTAQDGVPVTPASSAHATPPPSAWNDTSASGDAADDVSVPLPATVFAPPLSGADDDDTPPPAVPADAPTALIQGGSQLPRTAIAPAVDLDAAGIADAATAKAPAPPRAPGGGTHAGVTRGGGPTTPPPPGAPGTPGAR